MKDIAIYGAGGLGKEIACLIEIINYSNKTWNFIGFFDDFKEHNALNQYGPIIGGLNELNSYPKELDLAIAIGSPVSVANIINSITNKRIHFPNIIAPNLQYLDYSSINMGIGNIICLSCSLSCNINIGNFNLFNGSIVIGHDSNIGNFNSFMPSVKISGNVNIDDYNFFGVGSIVLQGIKIRNGLKLGAGSVLMKNPKEHSLYIGNPALLLKL